MSLPESFMWGGSTASIQYEGGWDKGGRGPTILDCTTGGDTDHPRLVTYVCADGTSGTMLYGEDLPDGAHYAVLDGCHYPNHDASDGYHRYKEDIALMAEMGFSMYRMSVSWSRIFPTSVEDEPNQEGLAFYRDMLRELNSYGIEPLVTLWHFDTPLYLEEEYGGWESRFTMEQFVRFAETCFREFKGLARYWLTFNEINNTIQFLKPAGKPKEDRHYRKAYQILHHQMLATAKAVQIAHQVDAENKIGCMINGSTNIPFTCDTKDVIHCNRLWQKNIFYCADVMCRGEYPLFSQRLWSEHDCAPTVEEGDLETLRNGTVDLFTFSYYHTNCVTTHAVGEGDRVPGNYQYGVRSPYVEYTPWGWSIDPDGLQYFMEIMYDRERKPILVVENGIGVAEELEDGAVHDDYRIAYHRDHIKAMLRAMEGGVDCRAYLTWGCIDIIAASTGQMSKRYGQVYVDVDEDGNGTYDRYRKDSFYWYAKCIRSNGSDLG